MIKFLGHLLDSITEFHRLQGTAADPWKIFLTEKWNTLREIAQTYPFFYPGRTMRACGILLPHLAAHGFRITHLKP